MAEHIQNRAENALSKEDVKHVIECATELRFGCIEQKETEFWDKWLENCPMRLGDNMFKKLLSEGLGFLNKSNEDLYKPSE